MFHFMSRSAPRKSSPASAIACDVSAVRGFVYCAASNINRAAAGGLSAAQADQLAAALANLEQLARATGSPNRDVSDLASWATKLARRASDLRAQREAPDASPLPMPELTLGDLRPRRASA